MGLYALNILDLIILAMAEGVADILPVDPSGHAVLVSKLMGFRAGSIVISIHFGAVLAILAYAWRDVLLVGHGLWKLGQGRTEPGIRLLIKILVAAAPWFLAQMLLSDWQRPAEWSDLAVIGLTTVLCAAIMGATDRLCMTVKRIEHMGLGGALLLGLCQLPALLPGVGRMAAAVTAARLLGLERPAAFRFLLLSSVPGLVLEGVRKVAHYSAQGAAPQAADILGCGLTFLFCLAAISLAMNWMHRAGLLPFTLYRLALGVGLVAMALT